MGPNGVGKTILVKANFMLILICVDAIGDSIFVKGIQEFALAIRTGNTWNYSLLPGTNILKVILFRCDIPTVVLGLVSGLILLFRSALVSAHPLYLIGVVFALFLGVAANMTLSTLYPVYFATAFAHELVTKSDQTPIIFLKLFAIQFFIGSVCLGIWL